MAPRRPRPGAPKRASSGRKPISAGPGKRPGAGRFALKRPPGLGRPRPRRRPEAAGAPAASGSAAPAPYTPAEGTERLQKLLAQAGHGSRRGCEELITQGRVTVNGEVVREVGTRVDPAARIEVDGEPVRAERPVYLAVYKPRGTVSTLDDPAGRPRVVDLVANAVRERVYTVGRLDEDSTGLMILTNDGALANGLAHPKHGVEKVYRAVVAGYPGPDVFDQLVQGVWLAEGKARARRVRVVRQQGDATVVEMVLAEGKNREVRRIWAKLGHKVMSLSRVAIGPITLKGLKLGGWRHLTAHEVDLLRRVARGEPVPTAWFGEHAPRHRVATPRRGAARHAAPPTGPRGRGPGLPANIPTGPAAGRRGPSGGIPTGPAASRRGPGGPIPTGPAASRPGSANDDMNRYEGGPRGPRGPRPGGPGPGRRPARPGLPSGIPTGPAAMRRGPNLVGPPRRRARPSDDVEIEITPDLAGPPPAPRRSTRAHGGKQVRQRHQHEALRDQLGGRKIVGLDLGGPAGKRPTGPRRRGPSAGGPGGGVRRRPKRLPKPRRGEA